jgi:hypothetical protein
MVWTWYLKKNGESLIAGPVLDQAVLHGVLNKVFELSLPLLSVKQIQSGS